MEEGQDTKTFDKDLNDRSVNSLRARTVSSSPLVLCAGQVLIM